MKYVDWRDVSAALAGMMLLLIIGTILGAFK